MTAVIDLQGEKTKDWKGTGGVSRAKTRASEGVSKQASKQACTVAKDRQRTRFTRDLFGHVQAGTRAIPAVIVCFGQSSRLSCRLQLLCAKMLRSYDSTLAHLIPDAVEKGIAPSADHDDL
jgi:hypothetical protein